MKYENYFIELCMVNVQRGHKLLCVIMPKKCGNFYENVCLHCLIL